MTERPLTGGLVRDTPLLDRDDTVERAVHLAREAGLPALPVVDDRQQFAGCFGEREFLAAVFPGYLRELGHAAFVPRSLDDALEKRASCRREPVGSHMSTESVGAPAGFSDLQLAEILLHHDTLIVPVLDDDRQVQGVVTRSDFVQRLADLLFETTPPAD